VGLIASPGIKIIKLVAANFLIIGLMTKPSATEGYPIIYTLSLEDLQIFLEQ